MVEFLEDLLDELEVEDSAHGPRVVPQFMAIPGEEVQAEVRTCELQPEYRRIRDERITEHHSVAESFPLRRGHCVALTNPLRWIRSRL
jgi:hypothetical protein